MSDWQDHEIERFVAETTATTPRDAVRPAGPRARERGVEWEPLAVPLRGVGPRFQVHARSPQKCINHQVIWR